MDVVFVRGTHPKLVNVVFHCRVVDGDPTMRYLPSPGLLAKQHQFMDSRFEEVKAARQAMAEEELDNDPSEKESKKTKKAARAHAQLNRDHAPGDILEINAKNRKQLSEAYDQRLSFGNVMVDITPALVAQYTTAFLVLRLEKLSLAYEQFQVRSRNFEGEKSYVKLLDDINAHKEAWWGLFELAENHRFLERCIAVLNTLATFRRQSGEQNAAQAILDVTIVIVRKYKTMTARVAPTSDEDKDQITCCAGLEYKHRMIQMNIFNTKGEWLQAAAEWRAMATYEIEFNIPEDQQFACDALEMRGLPRTIKGLRRLSDKAAGNALKDIFGMADASKEVPTQGGKEVRKKDCSGCGKTETFLREFKKCAGCGVRAYCGRACQKTDWKEHKKQCKGKNK